MTEQMGVPGLTEEEGQRLNALVDLLGRTGAATFQLRFQDDQEPVVWVAVTEHKVKGQGSHYEAAGGMSPLVAAWRLAETMVDGAMCTHCRRPAGMAQRHEGDDPLPPQICWYQYDPELKTFRRDCEGETP